MFLSCVLRIRMLSVHMLNCKIALIQSIEFCYAIKEKLIFPLSNRLVDNYACIDK